MSAPPEHEEVPDPNRLQELLAERSYLVDRGLATIVYLSLKMRMPLLLEGDAGVGKTELAKALAAVRGSRIIRLQCYEGIDVAHAVYDWNYARQMLYLRTLGSAGTGDPGIVDEVFGPEFLIRRPLLDAIDNNDAVPPLLLIDEIDRADDDFEAFLLEMLSDFQVTIPEVGTITARQRPVVVLTSNRTRELHDALKRRCLYHWLGHPSVDREVEIVRLRVPEVPEQLARETAEAVKRLRSLDLVKAPGVAETVNWATGMAALGYARLEREGVEATLGVVLKHQEDIDAARQADLGTLLGDASEPDDLTERR